MWSGQSGVRCGAWGVEGQAGDSLVPPLLIAPPCSHVAQDRALSVTLTLASSLFSTHIQPITTLRAGLLSESTFPLDLHHQVQPPPRPVLTSCPHASCTPAPAGRSCLRGGSQEGLSHAAQTLSVAALFPDQAQRSPALPLLALLCHSSSLSILQRARWCHPRAFTYPVLFPQKSVPPLHCYLLSICSLMTSLKISTLMSLPWGSLPIPQAGSSPYLLLISPCSFPSWH